MRRNQRYTQTDIIMPSLESKDTIKIVLAVDTSGSIDKNLLTMFISEIKSVVENISYESLRLIFCNVEIKYDKTFTRYDEFKLPENFEYGGGTAFSPVFKLIDQDAEPIDCLIYFTDLQCLKYGRQPSYPVLWIGVMDDEWIERCPFGEIVNIKQKTSSL